MPSYRTHGSCSREIIFQVNDKNELTDVKFLGGCSGNLQGISRLIKGKDIDYIIDTFKGIRCRNGTSCPDQLAKALIEYKESLNSESKDEEDEEDEEEEEDEEIDIRKKKKDIDDDFDYDIDDIDDDEDDEYDNEDDDEYED